MLYICFWFFSVLLFAFPFVLPTAVQMIAVAGFVYAVMQAAKQNASIAAWLTGWIAVLVNVVMTAALIASTTPPAQLYTLGTLQIIIVTALGSAGVHGTVSKVILKR